MGRIMKKFRDTVRANWYNKKIKDLFTEAFLIIKKSYKEEQNSAEIEIKILLWNWSWWVYWVKVDFSVTKCTQKSFNYGKFTFVESEWKKNKILFTLPDLFQEKNCWIYRKGRLFTFWDLKLHYGKTAQTMIKAEVIYLVL